MPQLAPHPPFLATPDSQSIDPVPSTSKLPSPIPTARPSSGSNSVEESQSPSGGGNETDDEREGSGSGVQTTREDSDEQVPRQHHHEMYPFPPMAHHQFQRHSSAEVEASSAGSDSSAVSEFSQDDDEDYKMNEIKRIEVPKRSLSEYRASLSRAGLAAPPPRIRRLGALGISVHSDSDVENPQVSGLDTNDRIDPASGGDTSSGTRETDLGVSLKALQAGAGSGSTSEGINVSRKRKRGVADATFRGIVDELAVENRHLKDKLRRYEAHGVPLELKESRLFEIRFYDGLPIDKRTELEGFLTHYVRDFVEKGPSSPPAPPPPASKKAIDFSTIRPPTPQASDEHVVPPSLPSPQESVRSERKQGRELADSSNSGVEPFSLSGIGSGVYRPAGFFPSQPFHSLGNPSRGPVPAIVTAQDRELAKSVISSLEQLFRHSLRQNKEEAPEGTAKRSRSNETYMANFLSHDFLSDGWVYLNLASTMAELHHYSVTLNFVQQAVRDHSHNLEVSEDGKRIRWNGPSPTSSPPLSEAPSQSLTTSTDPSRRQAKIASPAPTDSAASSGRTTVTQASENSSNPSSRDPDSNELLANSIAPTASTAPTSLAPSRSTNSKPAEQMTRPQRPTAAVLQRMDRLGATETTTHVPGAKSNSRIRQVAKGESNKVDPSVPQPSISFVAHPDSAMRQAPSIFHRLLRNQAEEDLEISQEELVHPGRALSKGPGMLVYYANGHFCSDLTQEEPAERLAETNRPFVLGAIDGPPLDDSLFSSKANPIDFDLEDDVGILNMDVDAEESSGEEGTSSVDSHASSLRRLSATGMTSTIPADLFTILVRMSHPRKHDRTTSSESPSNKRRRYSQDAPHILSSKAFHHRPLMTKRTAPVSFESTSSGDEPVVARAHLTTSNLAKHTQPSLQQITPPLDDTPVQPLDSFDRTPSPPHDDYLLSLSAPLHAWAPREYNSNTQRPLVPPRPIVKSPVAFRRRLAANPYPTRTVSDMSTTTGDERPISLDDPVASGSFR